MPGSNKHIHVSLIAIPGAVLSTISGIYDVLNGLQLIGMTQSAVRDENSLTLEIVAEKPGPVLITSGLPIESQRSISEIRSTDIVIIPSVLLPDWGWKKGCYDALVNWISEMHASGALLCSACSGILLLAESGLFDGRHVTVHWEYRQEFNKLYPDIQLYPDRVCLQELYITGYDQFIDFRDNDNKSESSSNTPAKSRSAHVEVQKSGSLLISKLWLENFQRIRT